jgi:hypothetical protein
MMRSAARLSAAVSALAVAAALAATPVAADESFEDPLFDAPGGAPDITTVAVSNTGDGNVTFQITIDNFETLPRPPSSRVHLTLQLDLDKNPSTGDPVAGQEASAVFRNILVSNGSVDFFRWNGSELADVPETNMSSNLAGGVLTFVVNRSELMGVAGFAFRIDGLTFTDGVGPAFDFAPDEGTWSYDLVFPPPTLSATKPAGAPVRPVAGRMFTVRSVVTRSDTEARVTSGTVRCTARIGSARLRTSGRFQGGRAKCVMAIPHKARGKMLRGTMTIGAAWAAVTVAFSFRIA